MVAVAGFAAGLVLLAVGAWMVYQPAGLIAAGALLAGVAVLYERGGRPPRRR